MTKKPVSLKKYIRQIGESRGVVAINRARPPRGHAQITERSEDVGLYDSAVDKWSRNARHHFSRNDIAAVPETINETVYEVGDVVGYQGDEVTVKIPHGPHDTVGIILEGKMRMVDRSHLYSLEEHIMGSMTELSPLNRVMKLAGIASNPVTEETAQEDQILPAHNDNTAASGLENSIGPGWSTIKGGSGFMIYYIRDNGSKNTKFANSYESAYNEAQQLVEGFGDTIKFVYITEIKNSFARNANNSRGAE